MYVLPAYILYVQCVVNDTLYTFPAPYMLGVRKGTLCALPTCRA
jgi:hypothetical protein